MMTNRVSYGKPDAGKPHVRFDEGEVASATPRRGSLLYTIGKLAVGGWLAACVLEAQAALKVYTVRDYVQDGLIVQYDGICNAGATAAHDAASSTWANIAPEGNDETMTRVDNVADAGAGFWEAGGYHFTGGSYFRATLPQLPVAHTVQLVTDAPVPAPKAEVFLRAKADYSFAYWWSGNTSVYWRNDPYCYTNALGETANGARPQMGAWGGRYVTFGCDESHTYAMQGTAWPVGNKYCEKARNYVTTVPSQEWTIGGQSSSSWNATGIVNSVRIYSRLLTNAELVQNRRVDEYRFRGNNTPDFTNVLVAASSAGLAGVESAGPYQVDVSHTFTAPDVTRADATYEAYGYTLQTWDASTATWGSPTAYTGNSYTYTGDETTAAVRLAWKWRLKSGLTRFSALDYVQDDLLTGLDGIENAGARTHDATAGVWTDFTGHDIDAQFQGLSTEAAASGCWTNACGYYFAGFSRGTFKQKLTLGTSFTIQLTGDFATFITNGIKSSSTYAAYLSGDEDFTLFGTVKYGTVSDSVTWKTDYYFNDDKNTARISIWNWTHQSITAGADGTESYLTGTRSWDSAATGAINSTDGHGPAVPAIKWSFMGAHEGSKDGIYKRYAAGTVYGVRFYTRKLTNAELAINRAVDDVRFRGGLSTRVGSVCVRAARAGGTISESGSYRLIGSHTFTAANVSTAASDWEVTGCYVEEWDEEKGIWTKGTFVAGNSCTVTQTADGAAKRLTWEWRTTRGLKSAADYSVNDYVTRDLVTFYDGRSNAGAAAAHDAAATTWADISGNGNFASFIHHEKVTAATGYWDADGYVFEGLSAARMSQAVDLGTNFTVETAVTWDPDEQTNSSPFIVSGSYDYGAFLWAANSPNGPSWKNEIWTTGSGTHTEYRPSISDWAHRYLVIALDANYSYMFQGTTYPSSGAARRARPESPAAPGATRWSLAGPPEVSYLPTRCASAKFHAARFYARKLTEAELLQNRKADEARYRGRLMVTNVVIEAGTHAELVGAQAPGAYEVEGTWTFTAAPVARTVAGREFNYEPTGYTLETLQADGSWGAPVSHTGTSYTCTSDSTPTRLTWKWRTTNGLTIIVR